MTHTIKPIVEPDNGSQSLYWLVFPVGSIATPTVILTDYEFADMVDAYLKLHNLTTIKGVSGLQR